MRKQSRRSPKTNMTSWIFYFLPISARSCIHECQIDSYCGESVCNSFSSSTPRPIPRSIEQERGPKGGALANMRIASRSVFSFKIQSPTGTKPVGLKETRSQMLPDQNRQRKGRSCVLTRDKHFG